MIWEPYNCVHGGGIDCPQCAAERERIPSSQVRPYAFASWIGAMALSIVMLFAMWYLRGGEGISK